MRSSSKDPMKELLKELNSFSELKKTYKTIYGASKQLKLLYPNAIIFDFISILSFNKGEDILKELEKIYLPDFPQTVSFFKNNAYIFFKNCLKEKKHLENKEVIEKMMELIREIPAKSLVLKYLNVLNPLLSNKESGYQVKIKLLIMIPNNYDYLYSEISKEFPLFPKSASDFYSYTKLEDNANKIKQFVEKKNSNEIKNENEALKLEIYAIRNDINTLKKEDVKTKTALQDLTLKYESLKEDIYKINLRDSIKQFLDKLLFAFDIFNSDPTLGMKIDQIKSKISILSNNLTEKEKKCTDILVDVLEHLKDLNKKGDNLSHYFNNLGFNIENLPSNVKEKYLIYKNGNENYDCVSLVISSLDNLITEKEEKVLNQFIKHIVGRTKNSNFQENKKELIDAIKTYSNILTMSI